MQKSRVSSLVLAALVTSGCGNGSGGDTDVPEIPVGASEQRSELARDTSPDVSETNLSTFAKDNRAFALNLYQALRATEKDNLFFSPYSISSALAMAYAGARGETSTEMASALNFSLPEAELFPAFNRTDLTLASRGKEAQGTDGKPFQLSVVNASWVQKDYAFEKSYLDTLAVNFGAGMFELDFIKEPEPARVTINDWVEKKTESRIQNLLPKGSIDALTRLVLTNAAYFNAAWIEPFEKSATREEVFHAPAGDLKTPMMHGRRSFSYVKGQGYEALLLPYSARELSMLVILPEEGTFEAFDAGLSAQKFEDVLTAMQKEAGSYDVDISLPRFEFESQIDLGSPLAKLGMTKAFTTTADFSGMTRTEALQLTGVVHKSFVSVDEEGTEAAAATGVIAGATSIRQTVEFKVDRPFLFAIYDQPTGVLLFMGRVVSPDGK